MRQRRIGDLFQTADSKTEKHVPVIDCPTTVSPGKAFEVKLSIGKEIPHPNSVRHHIRWMKLFFQPDGEKTAYEVAGFEFGSHGETAPDLDKELIYNEPRATVRLTIDRPGALLAISYCNIHGLWENAAEVGLL